MCMFFLVEAWVCVCVCVCVIYTYYSLLPLLFPQPDELLVLPRDEVNCCVLQQGSKYKQKTHRHPNVNGLHIGHLGKDKVTESSIADQ